MRSSSLRGAYGEPYLIDVGVAHPSVFILHLFVLLLRLIPMLLRYKSVGKRRFIWSRCDIFGPFPLSFPELHAKNWLSGHIWTRRKIVVGLFLKNGQAILSRIQRTPDIVGKGIVGKPSGIVRPVRHPAPFGTHSGRVPGCGSASTAYRSPPRASPPCPLSLARPVLHLLSTSNPPGDFLLAVHPAFRLARWPITCKEMALRAAGAQLRTGGMTPPPKPRQKSRFKWEKDLGRVRFIDVRRVCAAACQQHVLPGCERAKKGLQHQ